MLDLKNLRHFCLFAFLAFGPMCAQGAPPPLKEIRRGLNPMVFSEGYVMGHTSTATVQGVVLRTFEAEILLGVKSVPGGYIEEDCIEQKVEEFKRSNEYQRRSYSERELAATAEDECTVKVNPFYLSSYDTDWKDVFLRTPGELELVRYRANSIHPFVESPYFIKELIPVANYTLAPSFDDGTRKLNYGQSQVEGRVVMASLDGVVRKHYHLIMQLGSGGGKFFHVEVTTRELFDYIVKAMATGQMVRVHYYVLFKVQSIPSKFIMGYGNHLRAFRVDLLPPNSD